MSSTPADQLDEFFGPNAGYALELLERDSAVSLAAPAVAPEASLTSEVRASADVSAAAAAAAVAQSIRLFGHRAAHIDRSVPSRLAIPSSTSRSTARLSLTWPICQPSVVGGPVGRSGLANAAEAIQRLQQIYCGTTGYEVAHVADPAERTWLIDAIEEERFRPPNDPIDERELLDRLTEVSAFERFLHRAYPGQTRFSIEGLGMLIPMLDELIADAARRRHALDPARHGPSGVA